MHPLENWNNWNNVTVFEPFEIPKWDWNYYILAQHISDWSKDPRTKVGAVIVGPDRRDVSLGVNGFPPGWDDSKLHNREFKNRWVIHAERNALDRARFDTRGAVAYLTRPPCTQCAAGLISAGVARVVCPQPNPESSWYFQHMEALQCGLLFHVVND